MANFCAGFGVCLVAMFTWAAFAQTSGTGPTPPSIPTVTQMFMLAGGKGADGNLHMLQMDKEGRVICAPQN